MKDFESIYSDGGAVETVAGVDYTDVNEMIKQRAESNVEFAAEDLAAIENNFYELMRYRGRRSKDVLTWLDLNRPSLEPITSELLRAPEATFFGVGGMYGGFSYGLFERDGKPVLITDSWSRIAGGSGEQHEITPNHVKLVAFGFV